MSGALVHEWIAQSGGSEKVLDSFAESYPDADIFCLWNDAPSRYESRLVVETWLAKTPLRRSKALALPLMPLVWRGLRPRRDYDWMLISSHVFAHHARFSGREIPKLAYVHTPARYIWEPELDERGQSLPVRAVAPGLQSLDRRRAGELHAIAANSEFVRARVERCWARESTVIHPPVDVEAIGSVHAWRDHLSDPGEADTLATLGEGYVLGASRFVPYKRLDTVIEVAGALGVPAVIAGRGPDEARLRSIAREAAVPVTFVISPSDQLLYAMYQAAGVFVFPAIEDFGIMPVEAMAAGCPVVTLGIGGANESVTPGVSGFIADDSIGSLVDAAKDAMLLPHAPISSTVSHFSGERFHKEINGWLASSLQSG